MSVYSQAYRRILTPLQDLVRKRDYVQRYRFLDRSQWWSRDELLDFQWSELRRVLEWAFRSVPYYQEKYRQAGIEFSDIRTREDFSRLPILTRGEINEQRDRLCSTAYRGRLLSHTTGGSSGTPIRFFRTLESYDWRTAAKDRVYSWPGWRPGEKSIHLWGAPVGTVPKLQAAKVRAYDRFHRQLVINTFFQNEEMWERVHRQITTYRPKVIVGYVSSLTEFADFVLRRGLRIPTLEGVLAAAEPVFPSTRKQIAAAFGAPLYNTYGCREFMSLAGECECHEGMHVNAENVLVETASPASSGPSEVLVTDLHNYGMPFIRYALGDLAVLDDSACTCGRGLPRIQRIEGRVLDALRTADGQMVPGEFFPYVLNNVPEIMQYRVEQDSPDHVVILVVLRTPLSGENQTLIDRQLGNVLNGKMRWEIRPVLEIPRLASGKRRITVGLN